MKLSVLLAQVEKGQIRNTVLRQIKVLKKAYYLISRGKKIKEEEIEEYKEKNPGKVKKLKNQVSIMNKGLSRIKKAIEVLLKYKDTSVHESGRSA